VALFILAPLNTSIPPQRPITDVIRSVTSGCD
jgi:hypothetical protein